jgi:hypothetical protein
MKTNRKSIDHSHEDDMPCPCAVCGEWFDLNDGRHNPRKENEIICESCSYTIEAEMDREEEIQNLLSEISDAEYTIREAKKRLQEIRSGQ